MPKLAISGKVAVAPQGIILSEAKSFSMWFGAVVPLP